MQKLIKLIRLCKDARIIPDILLPPKYNSLSFVDKLPTELGTTPSNWFNAIDRTFNLLQFLKDVTKSKSPPTLFRPRRSCSRSSRCPKFVETNPTKLLDPRSIILSLDALHKEPGIGQKDLLPPILNNLRLGRVKPMFAGRAPLSWLISNPKCW